MDVRITEAQELQEVQPRGGLVINLRRKKCLQKGEKRINKASLFPV